MGERESNQEEEYQAIDRVDELTIALPPKDDYCEENRILSNTVSNEYDHDFKFKSLI